MNDTAFKNNVLRGAIQGIFENNDNLVKQYNKQNKKKNGPSKKDLETALTILLVDLASCDQKFDPAEYKVIVNGLNRIFGTTAREVRGLITQANQVLSNLRGTSKFAQLLSENLSIEDKKAIMNVINEVIAADGVEDGFELYLRHKLQDLLGVPKEELF